MPQPSSPVGPARPLGMTSAILVSKSTILLPALAGLALVALGFVVGWDASFAVAPFLAGFGAGALALAVAVILRGRDSGAKGDG